MKDLSLLASVAVIAIVAYGAYLLADVDRAQIVSLNDTIKKINDTLGVTPPPAETDNTKLLLYGGITVLLLASVYTVLKKK